MLKRKQSYILRYGYRYLTDTHPRIPFRKYYSIFTLLRRPYSRRLNKNLYIYFYQQPRYENLILLLNYLGKLILSSSKTKFNFILTDHLLTRFRNWRRKHKNFFRLFFHYFNLLKFEVKLNVWRTYRKTSIFINRFNYYNLYKTRANIRSEMKAINRSKKKASISKKKTKIKISISKIKAKIKAFIKSNTKDINRYNMKDYYRTNMKALIRNTMKAINSRSKTKALLGYIMKAILVSKEAKIKAFIRSNTKNINRYNMRDFNITDVKALIRDTRKVLNYKFEKAVNGKFYIKAWDEVDMNILIVDLLIVIRKSNMAIRRSKYIMEEFLFKFKTKPIHRRPEGTIVFRPVKFINISEMKARFETKAIKRIQMKLTKLSNVKGLYMELIKISKMKRSQEKKAVKAFVMR